MELSFETPWLVMAAAVVAVGASVVWARVRRLPPVLFTLAAAAMFAAGARPQVGGAEGPVVHALVVDVSDSMAGRASEVQARADEVAALDLPANHSFRRYELSDALRAAGGPRGRNTDYARFADLTADAAINGDIVFITDGRADLNSLLRAVDGRRLILLRAPEPARPDAAAIALHGPAGVAVGGVAPLRATLRCDVDADVPWQLWANEEVIASGTAAARAGVPVAIAHTHVADQDGLLRLRFRVDLPGDREARNDEAETVMLVGLNRDILYCVPDNAPQDALLAALEADAENRISRVATLPTNAEALRGVDMVVINNLSLAAAGATAGDMVALTDWVRSGGRLLMLGTDGAFGPGGYRGSALEDVMPVRFRPDDAPPRRTLLLLDVSSSMDAQRLARLREGATLVLAALDANEQAAVVGFRERLVGDVRFSAAGDPALEAAVTGLAAAGSTHIGTSLRQAAEVMQDAGEDSRIIMITDGEDTEGAGREVFDAIGAMLRANTRLEIVLTPGEAGPWPTWLAESMDARTWAVEAGSFDDLLQTLERVIAAAEGDWVLSEPSVVPGVAAALPRLVRTAPRDDAAVTTALSSDDGYPVLARRQLVGRSACLCTDSWGDAALADFWVEAAFVAELSRALAFMLDGAGAPDFALSPTGEQAEIIWVSSAEPPDTDLGTDYGVARRVERGRWVIEGELDDAEWMRVFRGDEFLQRMPIPRRPPTELRATGDDPAFFAQAEAAGLRVVGTLNAWQPRNHLEAGIEKAELAWLASLAALLLLLSGYALRKRAS